MSYLGQGENPPDFQQAPDLSQYNIAANLLRQANQRIIALEQGLRDNPSIASTMNRDVLAARKRYEQILEVYNTIYRAAFGNLPDQTGLGQWQLYLGAGLGIAALLAVLYELHGYISSLETKYEAEKMKQVNIQFAMNKKAEAQANGDQAGADQYGRIAEAAGRSGGNGGKPEGLGDFLKKNALWIAGGFAGFLVLREVL